MRTLPTWMRRALLVTAAMNILAGTLFLPPAGALRALIGLPPAEHAVYLMIVWLFVTLFGLGYLYAGVTGRADRLFIAISAIGKLSFVVIVTVAWAVGAVSVRVPLTATGDLVFAGLFAAWLLSDPGRA